VRVDRTAEALTACARGLAVCIYRRHPFTRELQPATFPSISASNSIPSPCLSLTEPAARQPRSPWSGCVRDPRGWPQAGANDGQTCSSRARVKLSTYAPTPSNAYRAQPNLYQVGQFLETISPYTFASLGIALCIGLSVVGSAWYGIAPGSRIQL
jgi:hypothetical protein